MKTEFMRDQQFDRAQGNTIQTHGPTMVSITVEEYAALRDDVERLAHENERLKRHCKDLDSDLQGTLADCDRQHGMED